MKKELVEEREECETVKYERNNLKTDELHDAKIELQKQLAISREISIENNELKTSSAKAKKSSDQSSETARKLKVELKQARDIIEEKEIKVQEVVAANKKLYKQIKNKVEICETKTFDSENNIAKVNTSSNPS